MYYLKRHFSFAGGHRLSKHKGLCKNFHGHNYDVWVTIKSSRLNENDMVMDFSDLKNLVDPFIEQFDHCLVVNECDIEDLKVLEQKGMKIISLPHDPTAERIAEETYLYLQQKFVMKFNNIQVDQVEVFENNKSSAIYRED